jgi:hypothetical protein
MSSGYSSELGESEWTESCRDMTNSANRRCKSRRAAQTDCATSAGCAGGYNPATPLDCARESLRTLCPGLAMRIRRSEPLCWADGLAATHGAPICLDVPTLSRCLNPRPVALGPIPALLTCAREAAAEHVCRIPGLIRSRPWHTIQPRRRQLRAISGPRQMYTIAFSPPALGPHPRPVSPAPTRCSTRLHQFPARTWPRERLVRLTSD